MKNNDTPKLFEVPTKREQEFLDLYKKCLEPAKIASIMGIQEDSVRKYVEKLRVKGLLPEENYHDLKVSMYEPESEYQALLQDFIRKNKDLFNLNPRKKYVAIDEVKDVIAKLGYRKNDVHLFLAVLIEKQLYEEAINLLNYYRVNNELSNEEYKTIDKLKHRLRIELLQHFNGTVPEYLENNDSSMLNNER